MQPHLGDMYGAPLPPMTPIRMPRYRHPGWIERGVQVVTAWIGVGMWGALLIALVLLMFFTAKASIAAETYRVPAVCKPLAERYGIPERVTADDAIRIISELERYSWWPGVRQCRNAVRKDWKIR